MQDAELIERARAGAVDAWGALVERYQQAVYRLAYLMLGDAYEAEDVAQDTLIRAYRSLAQYDERRPLRPWLLGITANLVRNRRRGLGRYWFYLERLARQQAPLYSDIETQAWEQARARALWEAVRQLNPTDQEIIYMRFFLELSVDETSAALNIAPGTVKSRLSRALDRLRVIIAQGFPLLWAEGAAHE